MRDINFKYVYRQELTGRIWHRYLDIPELERGEFNPQPGCIVVARCLSTGLRDKNERAIYEGDIVVNGLSGTWIVQPLEGGSFSLLGICSKYKDSNFLISALNDHAEVVGNIYENPELLTK